MTDYGRPDSDGYVGNYEDQDGGTTDLYQAIDEVTPSDADHIESSNSPSSDPYVCGLSTLSSIESDRSHRVRYKYAKTSSGAEQVDLTVELREGYTDEASKGTLIASWSHTDIAATTTNARQTLTDAEVGSITDYADLWLRFVFDMA